MKWHAPAQPDLPQCEEILVVTFLCSSPTDHLDVVKVKVH